MKNQRTQGKKYHKNKNAATNPINLANNNRPSFFTGTGGKSGFKNALSVFKKLFIGEILTIYRKIYLANVYKNPRPVDKIAVNIAIERTDQGWFSESSFDQASIGTTHASAPGNPFGREQIPKATELERVCLSFEKHVLDGFLKAHLLMKEQKSDQANQ